MHHRSSLAPLGAPRQRVPVERIVYPNGKRKEQGGARKHRLDLTGNRPATTSPIPVACLASVKIGSGPAKRRSAQPGEAGRSVGSVLRKGDVMTAHSAERRSRHGTTSKAGATAISAVSNATAGPEPKVCLRYGIAWARCDIKNSLAAPEASPTPTPLACNPAIAVEMAR